MRTNRESSDILVNHMSSISSVLTEWSRLKDVVLVLVKTILDTLSHAKEIQTTIQLSSSVFLAQLDKIRAGKSRYKHVIVFTKASYICSLHFVGVKWG